MTDDARSRLQARERELIHALRGEPAPAGIDEGMVALAAEGITRKRARQLARALPALATELGPDHPRTFAAFARAHPPPDGGGVADGLAFAREIARKGPLSADALTEVLVARASVALRDGRLVRRRAPYLAVARAKGRMRLVLVVRLPGAGLRVMSL